MPRPPFAQRGPSGTGATAALAELRRRSRDTRAGFEAVLDTAETEFRPIAQRFLGLHTAHIAALDAILAARGVDPEPGDSITARLNRAAVRSRAIFEPVDARILERVRNGERHVMEAFDAVLATDLSDSERDRIAGMRAGLDRLMAMVAQCG